MAKTYGDAQALGATYASLFDASTYLSFGGTVIVTPPTVLSGPLRVIRTFTVPR